jgi:hypothetical protein
VTYRTGKSWRITIVREGTGQPNTDGCGLVDDQLVAVVMAGKVLTTDPELAERICALLNGAAAPGRARSEADGRKWLHPTCVDVSRLGRMRGSEWVCGADCPRGDAPLSPLSATETAEQPQAGGSFGYAGVAADDHGHEHAPGTPPHSHGDSCTCWQPARPGHICPRHSRRAN